MKLYPSLISAPLLHLHTIIKAIDPYVDGYHIDIMDNHFVPNLTWGASFVHAIGNATDKPLWLHLMVDDPIKMIAQCLNNQYVSCTNKKNYLITVHQETITDWHTIKKLVTTHNIPIGIALNPSTPVEKASPYLHDIDHLLIMSVQPGRSGQSFLENSWQKIKDAHALYSAQTSEFLLTNNDYANRSCRLAIDGGVTQATIQQLVNMDVTMIAAAAAIFSPHPKEIVTCTADANNTFTPYLDQCVNRIKMLTKKA
jgi:ribulose-phosphate 3-epimerase